MQRNNVPTPVESPLSLVEQLGALLPKVQQMACFTNFIAYKVDKLEESQKSQFERISDDFASIFFRLNELYVTMSETERKSVQTSNSSQHE